MLMPVYKVAMIMVSFAKSCRDSIVVLANVTRKIDPLLNIDARPMNAMSRKCFSFDLII